MRASIDLSLYLVTDSGLTRGRDLRDVVREAVEGGVTIVQLREKEMATGDFVALARDLKIILDPYGVPLIINDRVDVALAADADGVHIGQLDMAYEDVRRLLGEDKIVGLSTENLVEVEEANSLDVDYIGISPVYDTQTKTDTSPAFGLEGCRRAVELTRHATVAIGGMNMSTVGAVVATGVDGVAVVSAIVSADDPRAASQELLAAVRA
ncbi:MAG: thiamine phosphate synthase [Rikenellaceae bacterium]